MVDVKDFFLELNEVKEMPTYNAKTIAAVIQTVETFARVTYQSVYLIDYYKQEFLYVTDNPLFLCGHTAEEVKAMGYSFYLQHVPQEEQKMLVEINRSGFQLFDTFSIEDKCRCSMSYDFHLQNGKKQTLVNHRLTPIELTADGRIWIAMCVVSPSSHKDKGHVELHKESNRNYWEYSFLSHKWKERTAVQLKDEEIEVLRLSAVGLTMSEIAEKMCKSVDSIKFYKRNVFNKLKVANIAEAHSRAVAYKLF